MQKMRKNSKNSRKELDFSLRHGLRLPLLVYGKCTRILKNLKRIRLLLAWRVLLINTTSVCVIDESEFVGAMDMDWKDREKSQDQDS